MSTIVSRIGRVSRPCRRAARQTCAPMRSSGGNGSPRFAPQFDARDEAALAHFADVRQRAEVFEQLRSSRAIFPASVSSTRSSRKMARLASAAAQPSWLAV